MNSNLIKSIDSALQYAPIRDKSEKEIKTALFTIISRAYALRGTAIEKDDVRFISSELNRSICERFPFLTIQEIGIAIDKGVKKDYGEYYGLSVVTFLDWIRAYSKSDEYYEARRIRADRALPEKVPPTPEEIEKQKRDSLVWAFHFYQDKKFLIDYQNTCYRYLVDNGILKLSEDDKKQIVEEAKKDIVSREADRRGIRSKDIHTIGELIPAVARDIAPGAAQLDFTAKRIAVQQYFDRLITAKKDIKDVLPAK